MFLESESRTKPAAPNELPALSVPLPRYLSASGAFDAFRPLAIARGVDEMYLPADIRAGETAKGATVLAAG